MKDSLSGYKKNQIHLSRLTRLNEITRPQFKAIDNFGSLSLPFWVIILSISHRIICRTFNFSDKSEKSSPQIPHIFCVIQFSHDDPGRFY